MAYEYPTEVRASLNDEQDQKAFEYTETLIAPGAGKWVEFPNGVQGASVDLIIGLGVGYVEATNGSLASVQDDTAVGTIWDKGTVSGTTQDRIVPVTAIRAVNVAGQITINVRMQ